MTTKKRERGMSVRYTSKTRGRNNVANLVSERRVILEWILSVQYLSVLIRLVQNLVILDSVMKFQMPFYAGNFSAKRMAVVFENETI
jgi:hypothetical protein